MSNQLIIKEEKLNDKIINEIMNIDKLFYKEDLSFEYYKERYSNANVAYCLYNENKMVGYVSKYGIKESLYNDLISGLYASDFDFDITLIDDYSDYIYISSIIILDNYRKQGYGIRLLDKVLNEKSKKYVAMAISNDGFNLLNKRMNLIREVTSEVFIFEI